MNSRKILLGAAVTQSTEAVVSLLKYLGKPIDPLPANSRSTGHDSSPEQQERRLLHCFRVFMFLPIRCLSPGPVV